MIQIACLLKHFLHKKNLCVPILINEAVSKQHEPTLSLRSIPQTSSVVPPAPWEQVIKFGELLSWNGSYLPGNWKWVSVMRKDCCKILLGWEKGREGEKVAESETGLWSVCCVRVSSQIVSERDAGMDGASESLLSPRIPLQWWLLVSVFPRGTAPLSSLTHIHNQNTRML